MSSTELARTEHPKQRRDMHISVFLLMSVSATEVRRLQVVQGKCGPLRSDESADRGGLKSTPWNLQSSALDSRHSPVVAKQSHNRVRDQVRNAFKGVLGSS